LQYSKSRLELRRFVSDTFAVASAHGLGALAMLGVQVVLVRVLSLDGYGAFALAQAFVLLFEAVFVPRSGEIALQTIGQAWHQEPGRVQFLAKRLRREELQWNLAIWVILAATAYLLSAQLKIDIALAAGLALAIPLQAGYGVSKAVIVVAHRIKQQSLFEICIHAITLFAVGVGVIMAGLPGAVAGYVAVAAIKTRIAHFWANRLITKDCPPDEASELVVRRATFRRLSAIAVWRNGCQAAAQQGDLLIVGSALGNDAAAIYKAAKTIAAVPGRAIAPLWGALRPRLMKAVGTKDRPQMVRLIVWPGVLVLAATVPIYFLIEFLAPLAVRWIFTDSYATAAAPLVILGIGAWIFFGATGWLGFLAIISERKRATTLLFTLNASVILLFGTLLGRDAMSMAAVVCGAQVITSAAAWGWFITLAGRHFGPKGS
jgi:O-antigen/teichoic acid export membrane protein